MKQVYLVAGETGDAVAFVRRAEAETMARSFDLAVTPIPLFGTAPTWFEDAAGRTETEKEKEANTDGL